MVSLRRLALVTVALSSLLAAGLFIGPASAVVHECHADAATVPVGTGNLMIAVPALDGVNHIDIDFPSCSEGRFFFGSGTSPAVQYQVFCAQEYLRLYANPGTVLVPFAVKWIPSEQGPTCSSAKSEPGDFPEKPEDLL